MQTDAIKPNISLLQKAADLLIGGKLVAFPTETVYGLGAIISNDKALREIFKIKSRPLSNPLLVHIGNLSQMGQIAVGIPDSAVRLMEKFWPGPLSLILPKHPDISPLITGSTGKVGLRMPAHQVALKLINLSGPLAATSANISSRPSPTEAKHVLDDLGGKIAALIDAGPTGLGIESTIIDLSGTHPKVLRLGGILVEEIEETMGVRLPIVDKAPSDNYISWVKIVLGENAEDFEQKIANYLGENQKVGIVHNNYFSKHIVSKIDKEYELNISYPSGEFFAILRDARKNALDVLVFAPFPPDLKGVNRALLDRIYKAVEGKT